MESLQPVGKVITFPNSFRIVTAIIGLVAVILSVLKHDGRLLEIGALRASLAPMGLQTFISLGAESILAPAEPESPDDCYRKELQTIRIAPGSRQLPIRPRARMLPSRRAFARCARRVAPRLPPRLVGIVVLRL